MYHFNILLLIHLNMNIYRYPTFFFACSSKKCYTIFAPDDNNSVLNDYMRTLTSQHKRTTPHKMVMVELAVYTDSLFTKLIPAKDMAKRIELMILKYNGVRS